MPLTINGERVRKGLAFNRKGYRVNRECIISAVSHKNGTVSYYRESDRWSGKATVLVSFEEFSAKFDGWTISRENRMRQEIAAQREQAIRDSAHTEAMIDHLIFRASRELGMDGDVLAQALTSKLESLRSDAYSDGYAEGKNDAYYGG